MKKAETPWSYRSGKTILHRLPAGLKLLLLLLLSLAAFIPLPLVLPGTALCIGLGAVAAKIKPWELLRGSGPLLFMTLVIVLFQSLHFNADATEPVRKSFIPALDLDINIDIAGLREGLFFGLRMAVSFTAGALLFAVTTMTELRKALVKAERFLHLEQVRLSLGIALMLGFIPRFFAVWEDANLAWEARSGKKGAGRFFILIPLVTERMMEAAAETAAALEARGALL